MEILVSKNLDPSSISESERILMEIINGRKPENDYEQNLLNEINKAKIEGKVISIPSM